MKNIFNWFLFFPRSVLHTKKGGIQEESAEKPLNRNSRFIICFPPLVPYLKKRKIPITKRVDRNIIIKYVKNFFFFLSVFLLVDLPGADGVVGEAGVEGQAVGGPGDGGAGGEGLLALALVGDEVGDGVLVLEIPDADLGVGGGAEPVAGGREGDLVDGLVAGELVHVLAAGEVPEAGGAVLGGGGAEGAVGGDGDGRDEAGVAAEGVEAAEVGEGPDLDEVVPAAGDEDGVLGGGGEADAGNPVGVGLAVEGVDAFALDVPDLELVVAAAGEDVTVVGGEGAGEDVLGVALELAHEAAGLEVPEAEGLVPGGGESELGVVGEGDVGDEAGVAFEAAAGNGGSLVLGEALVGGDPRADGVVAGTGDDLDGGVSSLGADERGDGTTVAVELTAEGDGLGGHFFCCCFVVLYF